MKLKDYVVVKSIEEVTELISKSRNNVILGGNHWLKMSKKSYNKGIDISNLGLDKIEEFEDRVEIGAKVSLRELEVSEVINEYFKIISQAVSKIVGIQFRNTATIGGSVYSRFAFSDLVAALMTLNTFVCIDGDKVISLEEFVESRIEKKFVTKIIIYKEEFTYYRYFTQRKSATDFPYFIFAMTKSKEDKYRIVVGARPNKAMLAKNTMRALNNGNKDINELTKLIVEEIELANNTFSSKEYREHLLKEFLKKGVCEL